MFLDIFFPLQFSVSFLGRKHNISRSSFHHNVGVCVEQTESLHTNEFLWFVELPSTISTLGLAWFLSDAGQLNCC